MGLNLRHFIEFATIGGAVLALAGCARMSEVGFDTKMALGSVSMVDRCSDFMTRAFPNGNIDVVGSHVATGEDNTLITVQGVRRDLAGDTASSDSVAVECHFASGVLTRFRWIAGPDPTGAQAQAP